MAEGIFAHDPKYRSKLLKEFGFEEEEKEINSPPPGPSIFAKTGFPQPLKDYLLFWEIYDLSLEEPYFWILHTLRESFETVEKLEDSFAAAENSAFFGTTQQRLGAQQDKVSQLLATVGKMIKELFQMVRELRIIDERMTYYEESEQQFSKPLGERSKSAEITLKGFFVDLVQGGGKSPASVWGMARELEYITLPDLFFDAPPFKSVEELDAHVKSLEVNFNRQVLRVLQRHLRQFMEWRKRTHEEHRSRQRFMLSYLRQHFDIIQMYITWIKPYLRHVARLSMNEKNMLSPDLISAFEGSMLDIELLARNSKDGANGCVLATFNYRTRPELKVVQEYYSRGPVHIGKVEIFFRVYAWTDEEVERYKKLKEKEGLILLGEVSSSVQEAMEALGDDLERYLELAKQKEKKEESRPEPQKSLMERMFGDFYTPRKDKGPGGKAGPSLRELRRQQQEAKSKSEALAKGARGACFNMYKNFKKAHRMIMW